MTQIRLGSLNTEMGETRGFGRAMDAQNVDILKTNEVSRRKGFVRRLEERQAGPIRLMHSFSGICGRFYSYVDGGGLITLSGPSYWAPTAFSLTGSLPAIDLSWKYQDRNGQRDTPPRGCSGVKVYRSTTGFIDTFDTGTLIYSGDGTSCVDDIADDTGSAVLYYTVYTVWEDNSRIVDPRIVMAWTYWGGPVEIPSFYWAPSSGELTDDSGKTLVSWSFNREKDDPEKEEAEEEIDEEDPSVSFADSAEFSALHTIDLIWAFNGAAKWNSGYTAIYRSLSPGMGTRGTLVHRSIGLMGDYTDTVADDYVTRYYTFVHYVEGVKVYTYEKTVAAKTHDLSLTAPATAYSGVAFSTVLQCLHWDGTNDTSYTPTDSLALSITGTSTAISPTSTDASGWNNGAKTVSTTLTCVGEGSTTIWATGAGLVASDTLLNKIHTLTLTMIAGVSAGVPFSVAIQGVGWEGGNDTSYVPSTPLTVYIASMPANSITPVEVSTSGWSGGAKTVSLTITGTTYGSDTLSMVNSIGDAGDTAFEYNRFSLYEYFNYPNGLLVGQGGWVQHLSSPSLHLSGGKVVVDADSTNEWAKVPITRYGLPWYFECTVTATFTATQPLSDYGYFQASFRVGIYGEKMVVTHLNKAATLTIIVNSDIGGNYAVATLSGSGVGSARIQTVHDGVITASATVNGNFFFSTSGAGAPGTGDSYILFNGYKKPDVEFEVDGLIFYTPT
jgi:hypothetical protein